jgi:putative ABC transport system permease protein
MRWTYKLPLRFRSLFRRNRVEQELSDELRFHLQKLIEENVAKGITEEEARYAALRELGGIEQIKEECRDMRRVNYIENFLQDVRYGLRQLRRSPGFTAVVVLTLALGIGANTAIFSLLDTVLLKMLPVQQPEELFFLDNVGARGPNGAPPYPCFERFRDESHGFSGMAAFSGDVSKLSIDGHFEQALVQYASDSYFEVLGLKPALGRLLVPGDERLNPPAAVISYAYWQRRFGGSAGVLGKAIHLETRPLTIVGVTPPEFFGLQVGHPVDLTIPISLKGARQLHDRGAWWLDIVGRLKPGVMPEQARAEIDVVYQNFMSEVGVSPEDRRDYFNHIELLPASKGLDRLRRMFSKPLLVLMALVGFVLLTCCANITNLLLARAAARQREFAVRIAIGAGRTRLIRQFLTETFLLFFFGSALALVFASWASHGLVGFFATGRYPILLDLHLDLRILGFTASLALITGLLLGLAQAFSSVRADPQQAMKEGENQVMAPHARLSAGKILVSLQVAFSLVLLFGAGLFIRTLQNLKSIKPGFRTHGVLTMMVEPLDAEYLASFGPPALLRGKAQRLTALWAQLLDQVRATRGVESASLSVLTPLSGRDRGVAVEVPGFQPRSDRDKGIGQNHVSDGYFETMGIPVLLGRTFTRNDSATAPKVAILNETAARFYFGDRNPLGARLDFGKTPISDGVYEVVGVVRNVKHNSLREDTPRFVFLPVSQARDYLDRLALAVRTSSNSLDLAPIIRQRIRVVGSNILVTETATLDQQIDRSLLQERLVSTLSGSFGLMALLIAAIGLYGIMSYSVVRRTRELGIRMALGARSGAVVWLVLRETLLTVGLGIGLGTPAALLLGRTIGSLIYGLKPSDPVTVSGSVLILGVVATLAGYLPARRASKVDPMVALRHE